MGCFCSGKRFWGNRTKDICHEGCSAQFTDLMRLLS